MKKNFLKVAALLIAAMLMVVSCTQEVAPVDNGLVEAKLSVGYGRDLTVTGDTKTKNMVLEYTMSPAWTNPTSAEEEIIGEKTTKTTFTDGGKIGYVTPGLWTINVYAYEAGKSSDSDAPIFEGSAQAYFSSQNDKVTVYLAPVGEQSNSIRFAISMQDLVGTGAGVTSGSGSYELRYTYQKTNSSESSEVVIGEVSESSSLPEGLTMEFKDNVTNYYAEKTGLESGYYRVTVKVYSVKDGESTLVGGISKGFLLSGNSTATVKGHIEPSDYESVSIEAFFIDVKTSISAENITYTAGTYDNPGTASVTLTVDITRTEGNKDGITPTYVWYVAGVDGTTTTSTNSSSFTVNFKAPGYKTVTCQTVYSTSNNGTPYYFADTQSFRVYVDPEKFNTATTGPAQKTQQTV